MWPALGQIRSGVGVAETRNLKLLPIEGELSDPPSSPEEGECWLVGAGATGDWEGEDGRIACRQAGNWLFVSPRDGMQVLDRSSGQTIRHLGTWQIAATPAEPVGGTTADVEARAAIANLIEALRIAGVFAAA